MEQLMTVDRTNLDRAMKPFALPLGLASPMWMAYGAAAGVTATWWWMSRMSRFVAPKIAATMEAAPAPALAEPEISTVVALPIAIGAIPTPVEAAAEAIDVTPDELTLLRGVGPRVADAFVARGVTTFAQLATWTEDQMAAFDAETKLLGRSKRYDFIGQAKELSAAL